jgi:cardiolipin synthase A/B
MQTFIGGNAISLLRSGAEYFPAVVDAINCARASVYIETYIFADDASGELIADALIAAVGRGLDVRVVIDSFGTKPYLSHALEQRMRKAAVLIVLYRREVFKTKWRGERLRRLHRKLVVIDGERAFVGGINVIDDMNTPGQTPPRVDFAIHVEGPIMDSIVAAVARLWRILRLVQVDLPGLPALKLEAVIAPRGNIKAKFVVRDNLRFRRQIEWA